MEDNRTELILKIDNEYLFTKESTIKILEKITDKEKLINIILELVFNSNSEFIENYIFNNYVNLLSNEELEQIIKENKQFI